MTESMPKKDATQIQQDLEALKNLPGVFEQLGNTFNKIFGEDAEEKDENDHE